MELNELVKRTVKQVINEIAGANDNAIRTINELVGKLEYDLEHDDIKSSYIVNAPYGGMLNVILCDEDDNLISSNAVACYSDLTKTVYIRKSRIGCNGWQLMIKSDLIHEFTHNIQMSQEHIDSFGKRKRYRLNYKPTTELAKKISYQFDDDEMSTRISEAYYEFTESIRGNDIDTIRSKEFRDYVFKETWVLYHINKMTLLIYDVRDIEANEHNCQQLLDIGMSINNKSYDRSKNREKNISVNTGKQSIIHSRMDDIENEKNVLKKIVNSITLKHVKLAKEYIKQQELIDKEIRYLKNMIIKIMSDKLDKYKDDINKSWNYLVADYINNNGNFSMDVIK